MAGFKVIGGGGSGGPSGPAGFTDDFSINIKVDETNAAQTDVDTYQIALAQSDSNAAQSESVSLGISGHNDTTAVPTDAISAKVRIWLSGSAGTDVASPANANGQNDSTNAVVSTGVLASNPETMTSDIGTNVPGGVSFSSATYRGWFRARTTLVTSTAAVIAHSNTAAFTDIVMFTQSSLDGDTNHLSGTFTFDLLAAGVDTAAKLTSLQIYHRCTDLAAGVTPAILDVDAGSVTIDVTTF